MTTTYAYDPVARQVTVTLPNGGTRIQTTQMDGSAQQITGTAVVPEYYTYESQANGVRYVRVNIGADPNTSSPPYRIRESWTDSLGRAKKNSRPGFNTQPAFVEQFEYDSTTGRLLNKTQHNGSTDARLFADTRYEYDALSQVIRSGLDLDASGTLVLSSSDRIADTDQSFWNDGTNWWLKKVTQTYPTAGSNSPIGTTTKQRLTGYSGYLRSETVTIDVNGNITTQQKSVNTSSKTTTITTTTTGISNTQTETYVNGLPVSITRFDGLFYSTGYDALGRLSTSTDPRTGTTTTYYKTGSSFVWYVKDAVLPVANANTVVSYTYDNAGRVTAVTDAAGKVSYTSYTSDAPIGQVERQWGDTAYPVEYGYNSFGERTTMKTYRNGSGWTGSTWPSNPGNADQTTWNYDTASGLVSSKTDAGSHTVSYTYNARGQILVRTLARGVSATYAYYGDNLATELATGELRLIDYSDSTPDVSYAYNRAGALSTVNGDATGSTSFAYDSTQALQSVTMGTFYGSRVMTCQYDAIKRPAGFLLGTSGNPSADLSQIHAYHATNGRFNTVTTQATRTFTYSYNTGGLVSGLSDGSSFSVARGYEPYRNLLTSIDSQWSGGARIRYEYTYNNLGQRATAKQLGSQPSDAFADFGGSTYYRYVYNDRGEVTQAVDYQGEDPSSTSSPQLTDRRFGFAYDTIGNRTTATRALGTDANDIYHANALNQYDDRENDAAYIAGTARSDSTIAVTGGTTPAAITRAGNYWGAQTTLANTTTSAVKTDLTVTATLTSPSVVRTESRSAFLSKSPQIFSYDDDGNMTSDSVWTYYYDAENRLVRMTTTTGVVNVGYPSRDIWFSYDYLGRRVQKYDAVTSTGRRYLYDGWNLVAEFDAPGGTSCSTLLHSYTWGLDLAGSLTATGGVGALLQLTDHTSPSSPTSYFPTYDGNGNIAALLKASDGTVSAKYEYSPSGELLRVDGAYAQSNPFRFSTKFTDDESGLVYYGHRFYSASLGRFINRDPIEEAGGLNLYGFCGNDGVNRWDVLGNLGDDKVVMMDPFVVTATRGGVGFGPTGGINVWKAGDVGPMPGFGCWGATPLGTGLDLAAAGWKTPSLDLAKEGIRPNSAVPNSSRAKNVTTADGTRYTIYPNGIIVRHTDHGDVAFTRNPDGSWKTSFCIAVADGGPNNAASQSPSLTFGETLRAIGQGIVNAPSFWNSQLPDYTKARAISDEELANHLGHNDLDDAIRHADWSRRMEVEIGPFTAWSSGVGHEIEGIFNRPKGMTIGQYLNESLMDLHNNSVGRNAGASGAPIDNSQLITSPSNTSINYRRGGGE
jgi:RHS repeat-associated protein